jgi:hypothetical protein
MKPLKKAVHARKRKAHPRTFGGIDMDVLHAGTLGLIAKWKADPNSGFVVHPLDGAKPKKEIQFRKRTSKAAKKRVEKLERRIFGGTVVETSRPSKPVDGFAKLRLGARPSGNPFAKH